MTPCIWPEQVQELQSVFITVQSLSDLHKASSGRTFIYPLPACCVGGAGAAFGAAGIICPAFFAGRDKSLSGEAHPASMSMRTAGKIASGEIDID